MCSHGFVGLRGLRARRKGGCARGCPRLLPRVIGGMLVSLRRAPDENPKQARYDYPAQCTSQGELLLFAVAGQSGSLSQGTKCAHLQLRTCVAGVEICCGGRRLMGSEVAFHGPCPRATASPPDATVLSACFRVDGRPWHRTRLAARATFSLSQVSRAPRGAKIRGSTQEHPHVPHRGTMRAH